MTTSGELIAKLPKERQQKLQQLIQQELKEYGIDESIDFVKLNKKLKETLD